ncbi:MAG: hypothetical protein FIA82_07145 [Melioribacter sp.]|nr:hypothetical protein [Melioribacter sp.]
MYFVIVKEISTGKIIDKAELAATGNIGSELAHLAWLTIRQLENKYPSDKYNVTYQESDNWESLLEKLKDNLETNDEVFTMSGSRTYVLMVSVCAMIAGIILMFILLVIRLIYNPFLFILGIMIFSMYFFFDFKRWMKKGIQKIQIDRNGLTIFRGNENKQTRIDKNQITGINVFKKLNRRVVNILLGGQANSSLPGVTLFSGPRIRITDDAFNEAEFGIFMNKLLEWKIN